MSDSQKLEFQAAMSYALHPCGSWELMCFSPLTVSNSPSPGMAIFMSKLKISYFREGLGWSMEDENYEARFHFEPRVLFKYGVAPIPNFSGKSLGHV